MFRLMAALLIALAVSLLSGPQIIKLLRRLKVGKKIYELGPKHQEKEGTPLMGGIMIVLGVVIAVIICHIGLPVDIWNFSIGLTVVSLLSMAVGLTDDLIQVIKKQHDGLTPMQKIIGQVALSAVFAVYCYFNPDIGSVIWIPLANVQLDLGIFYIPLVMLLVIFMVNSSNLQDGLDGLEGTHTSVAAVGLACMALVMAQKTTDAQLNGQYEQAAVFALALAGGAMGYLRYNRYPAKVFMGDCGSMFIGGAVVGIACVLRQPLMVLIVCFTMVMSSGSVMIQRVYFKLTHGKRIFKMSPIHHHFELCGYKETQIVSMYAIITGVLSILAVLSLYGM